MEIRIYYEIQYVHEELIIIIFLLDLFVFHTVHRPLKPFYRGFPETNLYWTGRGGGVKTKRLNTLFAYDFKLLTINIFKKIIDRLF